LLLRFAPVYQNTVLGEGIALVGGVTFLVASILAVSQNNAKRVLAYSTIANLGLIVACAGVGSHEALWAAFLLILFHGVAKALLFLAVGSVEHQVGSRDIEDMDGLIIRHRGLAVMIMMGMMGMFVAPFGMLISKWACLVAFLKAQPILAILVAYGSAPTLFFWTKWMGKLAASPIDAKPEGTKLAWDEWTALGGFDRLDRGGGGLATNSLRRVGWNPSFARCTVPRRIWARSTRPTVSCSLHDLPDGGVSLPVLGLQALVEPGDAVLSGLNVEGLNGVPQPARHGDTSKRTRATCT
jgi:hypothetical protein